MEPDNDGFQKESPFPGTYFQVPCYISGCVDEHRNLLEVFVGASLSSSYDSKEMGRSMTEGCYLTYGPTFRKDHKARFL